MLNNFSCMYIYLQLLSVMDVSYCMSYVSCLSSRFFLRIHFVMFVSWNDCFLS
jgi:hypothetical protein